MPPIPDDIKDLEQWCNVIRRIQSMAHNQRGYAVVTIQVMVDENGHPVLWTDPAMAKLEPQGRAREFLRSMISGMGRLP
jgi:hypothetical protein